MHIKHTAIFIVASLAISNVQSDCSNNETYNPCGSACGSGEGRCTPLPKPNEQQGCIQVCVPRCECKRGYSRNEENVCILSENCPKITVKTCGKNEVFNKCGSGCRTRNETRCDGKPFPRTEACPKICRELCECAKGYARNQDDQCILEAECAGNKCNPKTEYLETCASSCAPKKERNCTPPQPSSTTEGRICTAVCVQRCECKFGYSRDNKTNTCVITCP